MIGGIDVVFWVRDDISAAEVILRTLRRHWPNFVIEDADDPAPFLPNPGPWLPTPAGREFFAYKDEASAMSWEELGATPENRDAMIYVILGNRRRQELGLRSLTLVCGHLTGQLKRIVEEIDESFEELNLLRKPPEAA